MHPYFIFKDLVTIFFFLLVLSIIIFYYPNLMGHSDNYIPADPMVTPISIALPFIFKNKIIEFNKNNTNKEEILIKLNKSSDLFSNNKPSNNFKLQLEEHKFNQIVQGIFQSKCHIGGYFISKEDVNFKPLVYIYQNASNESIIFFKQLNILFDNKMKYIISLTSNNKYQIRLQSKDFNFIIKKFIPYFSNLQSDKYLKLIYLEKLYHLLDLLKKESQILELDLKQTTYDNLINGLVISKENNQKINILKFKIINLVYNLLDNSKKNINININIKKKYVLCKLNSILIEKMAINYIQNIKTNSLKNVPKLNNWFLYGLYLGNGKFSVSIKKDGILPLYFLRLKMFQKNTINNLQFIEKIIQFYSIFNIKSYYLIKKNSKFIEWYIEDTNSLKKIKNIWCENNKIWLSFWKHNQLKLLIKTNILINQIKYWKEGQLTLLNIIYKYTCMSKSNYSNWYKKILYYFEKKNKNKKLNNFLWSTPFPNIGKGVLCTTDLTFIFISKNTSWLVSLPINVKPKAKYFFFKTYLTKDKALEQALRYRDQTLNDWLHSNNLI